MLMGALRPQKHGLYVKAANGIRLRSRKVQRLVERLRGVMSWLEQSDLPAARAWAELEILATTVFAELHRNGPLNSEGEPRRLISEYRQLRATQLVFERELGMTPAACMAIKANGTRAALDLAKAFADMDDTARDSDTPEPARAAEENED
jgi:hypothetical protein